MNERTSDSDDVESPNPKQGQDLDPGQGENPDPDEDEQRSLEDRWQRFLTGEAEEERRRRLERRRARLRGEDVPEAEAGEEGVEAGKAASDVEGQGEEQTEAEESGPATESAWKSESRLFATEQADAESAKEEATASADEEEPSGPGEGQATTAEDEEQAVAGEEALAAPGSRVGRAEKKEVEPEAPLVVPARDELDLPVWRRKWKSIVAVAALVVVAFLVLRGGTGGGEESAADTETSSPSAEQTSGIDTDRVRTLTDSLEAAIGRYRERKRDYDLNRLGCAGLSRGYEGVQSALGELRSAMPYAEDLSAGPLRSRYRSLVSSAEAIDEGYAATDCGGTPRD